ncbi:M48 family metalloprotease [Aliisedimentitalea scapharcae]|uniref:M48 family metalloprotease n=1 Tax=Aliisedimentitalea scapharcae TaxID=1524259 RepID=A0ABZ2XNM7_9RHOB
MAFERVSRVASIPAMVLTAVLTVVSALPAAAVSLLRDPDIEHALRQIASPVLRASGLSQSRTHILLVDDPAFNAFVLDNQAIFLNYGLILKVDSAGMLQAVIAHEAAHITNGHLARRTANLQSARTAAGLGLALAALAAAAGGGEAAGGIAIGTQSAAQRVFLSHTRAEEASADRSAASYLTSAGVSPQALVDLHQAFAGQEVLSVSRQDPYTRSHPLTRDRLRAAQAYVAAHGGKETANPDTAYWFARARGKVSAFTRSPKWTLRRVAEEKYKDVRLMREAIAHHRQGKFEKSISALNKALALRPSDPFYLELKGQIYMENRRWNEALNAYGQAVSQAPQNAQILSGYGRAQLAAGQPKSAIQTLEKARSRDWRDARLLRDMSVAYAKTGQSGMAAVVTAERYALQGRLNDAGLHAKRASALLPRGSAAWRRAQDVLIASERFAKGKKKR